MTQDLINEVYCIFVEIVKTEMDNGLNKHVYKVTNGNNKSGGTRSRKPWWTEELSDLWNCVHESERAWLQKKDIYVKRMNLLVYKNVLIPLDTDNRTTQTTETAILDHSTRTFVITTEKTI